MICYTKQLSSEWYRIAKSVQEIGRRLLGGHPLWRFIDFVVTTRTPLFMILHPFIQYMVGAPSLYPVYGESSTPSSSTGWVLQPFTQYMVSAVPLHPVHGESSTLSPSTWWVLYPFIQYIVSSLPLHPVHGESSTLSSRTWWVLYPFIQYVVSPPPLHPVHDVSSAPSSSTGRVLRSFFLNGTPKFGLAKLFLGELVCSNMVMFLADDEGDVWDGGRILPPAVGSSEAAGPQHATPQV